MLTALVTILTSGQGWAIALSVAIGIIGKFLISMTFAIAYLYTAELFPTKVRNLAVGLASTFARIGSISAPYIVDLLGSIHAGIPVVIFGLCSFAAGITSLMLPETLNKKMPESVAEIERSGKQKKESPEQEEMNAVSLPAETKAEGGE
jgi:OCT family organic cation transporter-like MFS transporter 4/5